MKPLQAQLPTRHTLKIICIFAVSLASCVSAQSLKPDQIQGDIDHMMNTHGKISIPDLIAPVVKDGTNAVPLLIERYGQADSYGRDILVACLCQIPTVESLDFVKTIIRNKEDRLASSVAIRDFPVEQEDQITLLLVDLLKVQSFEAPERLRQMIFRKPSRAGVLVNAMDLSDPSMTRKNQEIGEVLAFVSGYSYTWPSNDPTGTDEHDFWAAWWKRNNDKEPFDWLVETFKSDPNNDERKAQAIQILGLLRDPRSTTIYLEALDDKSEGARYWAVVNLLRVEGTYSSYTWETFKKEEPQIISRLKQKFSSQIDSSLKTQ